MDSRFSRASAGSLWGFALAALALALPSLQAADKADPASIAFFESKVRPVLIEHCYSCHSAEAKKAKGGLQVDSKEALLKGGESGPAIVPGKPEASLFIKAVRHADDHLRMPPKAKLPDQVIADLEKWVTMGAPDPRTETGTVVKKGLNFEEERKHWAYQPVRVASPPVVTNADWPRGAIDRYILAGIEAKGLRPAADAANHTLLRRLTFDLVGLPPTPEELAAFEHATRSRSRVAAVEEVVERLLASPRFGEHWARHWLDGVRYNPGLPTSELYRNWVVQAYNADLPYDKFLQAQLAGDLLPEQDPARRDANLIATQMLCFNAREMDPIEGTIEVVGQQLLAVSINCAKCHDHKFDPFTQQDYYGLAGIFTSSRMAGAKGPTDGVPLADGKTRILALQEGKIGDTNLLVKGEKTLKGPIVERRFPVVLAGEGQAPLARQTKGSGRLELARWITDPRHPLTARVMANRVWQRLIGRGLVATPNDFGKLGEAPTHPELLDYLADRFVKSGWSAKSLIREIVLSRTYQQASRTTPEIRGADLENRLLTRMPFKRLQYEQIIDSLLAVSGKLEVGPPPAGEKGPPGGRKFDLTGKGYRALYLGDSGLANLFDGADPELLVEKRAASVTGPQMLFFLNNPNVVKAADAVAARTAGAGDEPARVRAVYRLLFSRDPSAAELKEAAAYLQRGSFNRYCHTLLCANEFIYLD